MRDERTVTGRFILDPANHLIDETFAFSNPTPPQSEAGRGDETPSDSAIRTPRFSENPAPADCGLETSLPLNSHIQPYAPGRIFSRSISKWPSSVSIQISRWRSSVSRDVSLGCPAALKGTTHRCCASEVLRAIRHLVTSRWHTGIMI